ncbi:hypothetical protein JNK13_11810 [bacterium]|nr:hypothetical protein [bacterium]
MEDQYTENDNQQSDEAPIQTAWFEAPSGQIVIIDQFMLSNRQFLDATRKSELTEEALKTLVARYGGAVISLQPGRYHVKRNPYESLLVVVNDNSETEVDDQPLVEDMQNLASVPTLLGHVFIDTRCVVFMSIELLANQAVIDEHFALRTAHRDKQARDFLRAQGACVRYGFKVKGDELSVFKLGDFPGVALWEDHHD